MTTTEILRTTVTLDMIADATAKLRASEAKLVAAQGMGRRIEAAQRGAVGRATDRVILLRTLFEMQTRGFLAESV